MRKLVVVTSMFVVSIFLLIGACATVVSAQTTPHTALPRCNVGADPVNASRQPTTNEEVVSNPADQRITYKSGNGLDVTCILQAGVPVVVDKTTGVAGWVYGCGNPISTPWAPKRTPSTPIADAIRGLPGKDGYTPIKGVDYFDGKDGLPGRDGRDGKNGFCSSTKCKIVLGVVGTGLAIGGYEVYRYYNSPCPPGTYR